MLQQSPHFTGEHTPEQHRSVSLLRLYTYMTGMKLMLLNLMETTLENNVPWVHK